MRAPFDGTVVSLVARRAGVVTERGETLCELARSGSPLRAELEVSGSEAGKVAAGQRVKLLFDAYPYPRYGTRLATLSWVSPAGAGQDFRSLACLDETMVSIDGVALPLRAGMCGEARIVMGSRTLVEYAPEPLRALRENVTTPPDAPPHR